MVLAGQLSGQEVFAYWADGEPIDERTNAHAKPGRDQEASKSFVHWRNSSADSFADRAEPHYQIERLTHPDGPAPPASNR